MMHEGRTLPLGGGSSAASDRDAGAAPSSSATLDPERLDDAWRLLRNAARRLDRVARGEGWPTPFPPARYLILARLGGATRYGLSARHFARALDLTPSTVAHHVDVLERAGFVLRASWTLYDRRKVAVRITDVGRYALRRLTNG